MGTTTSSDISQTSHHATDPSSQPTSSFDRPVPRWQYSHLAILLALWLAIFVGGLAGPPLLDDADATHAQAAQAMLTTSDWVTLHVDGIRYLEKPPLPYWIAAISLRLFPAHPAFAIHLPLALTVLGLALLGYAWSRRAFSDRAALYCGIFVLTSVGTFLFTRVFIPDALLSLLLAIALYALLNTLSCVPSKPCTLNPEPSPLGPGAPFMRSVTAHERDADTSAAWVSNAFAPYILWLALALAVLTKGLVALVFFFGTALIFMTFTGDLRHWRRLRPVTGILLFLLVAAPWHILAGLRNTGGAQGHGFFWFYFINEHVLRFLGRRIPRDYNKLPFALYWSLHLVWLFPWSLFAPAAIALAWKRRSEFAPFNKTISSSRPEAEGRSGETPVLSDAGTTTTFAHRTILLLAIFSTLVLVFFSVSTNQEYYTLPVYLPLLMLLAAALAAEDASLYPLSSVPYPLLFSLGTAITAALAYGLWTARHLAFVPDIGSLLAHRGVGDYTLSMSHFFDLTGESFAALRLPATLAALAFAIGPATAWLLHRRGKDLAAVLTVAITSATFLIAAHIALVRFAPMLSSRDFATTIQATDPNAEVLIFGDQAFGSSLPFYLHHHVSLVDGRSTSMLFGSTFPDAPPLFLTPQQLVAQWGNGPRKLLFVPAERRDDADHLLDHRTILLKETSGKALFTDRPVDINPAPPEYQGKHQ